MLPFERASQNSWLGHIFVRKWRPYQKFTFLAGLPVAQNLSQSRFSCMLIPFSMDLLDCDEGIVQYSPLYGQGSKVTILVGQSRILLLKERPKKLGWDSFLFEIGDLTKSSLFRQTCPTPFRGSFMKLFRREAPKQSESRFCCMLVPFSMFLLYSDEEKVKY